MKILFIGPQGSGKSTQAKLLAKYLKITYLSTGDIFRKISLEKSSAEGQRIRHLLESGHLVDDETTAEIVKKRVTEEDCQNGFILDGYPRNLNQVQLFDPGFDQAIFLNVPAEQVIERLTKRGRADDTPELIKKRLELYFNETQPILNYYRKLGKLIEIDGQGEIDQIQNKIRDEIS
ncbi:nucleoside monophosphate kinase [Candidatus Daviesbacteria bacterium]|nr:nucleoside monophosphate kinase [Candidatus Daviesbacteria bacterium]